MFDELPGSVIKNLSRPITLSNPCSTGTLQRWSGWGRWGSKTRGAPRIPPPIPCKQGPGKAKNITVSRETALVTIFNVVQKTSRGNGPLPPVCGFCSCCARRHRWLGVAGGAGGCGGLRGARPQPPHPLAACNTHPSPLPRRAARCMCGMGVDMGGGASFAPQGPSSAKSPLRFSHPTE